MKFINNIKEFYYNILEQYYIYNNDKKIKKIFDVKIKEESNDRESFFNNYNLRTLNDFKQIVQVIDIPEEYQLKGQQWQIMDKLNENTYFTTKYLKDNLGFGDNVTNPEYYHIEDPSSNTPFSCRYLAIWKYTPVLKSKKLIYTINSIITILSLSGIGGLILLFI